MLPEAESENEAVFQFLLRMGDNCLVLSHRLSEWCGHSPALEEDIAQANTALDLLGQAQLWLDQAGKTEGRGRSADDLAYWRDTHEYRNALLLEQRNGDFAETLMRQFLFDAWHLPIVQGLRASSLTELSDIAAKATPEITYHLDRSSDLVIRLGDGSEESHVRMQDALNRLWRFTGELMISDDIDLLLAENQIAPQLDIVRQSWSAKVDETLTQATLQLPENDYMQQGGKNGVHTEHLGYILAQMQYLQRAYPGASW